MELYETKEWDEKISKIHAQAVKSGGGSNMAEPPYVPPPDLSKFLTVFLPKREPGVNGCWKN